MGDCSNNGISSFFNSVTIMEVCGKPIDASDEPRGDSPAVRILRKKFPDDAPFFYYYAEPVDDCGGGRFMMGGTLLFCSDSRFREITGYAIALHDRQER